ncbi:MAG: Tellurite resistance protein TerB [Thermoleophilia bacterium]|nr:Tellurite resistance protein TerB [Thermoleophilia bacterium]
MRAPGPVVYDVAMKFKIQSIIPSFVERRRRRQYGVTPRTTWSFDLVQLRVQLLFAMAAADGRLVPEEIEAIDRAIEQAPVPAASRERLREIARRLALAPPELEPLLEPLTAFWEDPPLARALVTDLARVAAVDQLADPREQELLERVCAVVGVDPVRIPAPRPAAEPVRRVRRAPSSVDRASQERIRDAVRRALESSYEQDAS